MRLLLGMIKGEMGRSFVEIQTSSNLIKSALIKGIRIKRCFATLLTSVLLLGIFQMLSLPVEALAFQEDVFSIWTGEVGNQAEGAAGGFYLITEPGEEQQISVRVVNLTDEYRTLEVSIHVATTDNQGRINYWGSDEPADTTLPHNIEDLLIFEPYIVLEPNEETYFWVTVRMPTIPYQGVLAGGLVFRLAEDSFHEDEGIIGEERLLAVLLRQDGFVESNIVLERVTTEVLGGQSVISAHLRNVAANFVGQMRITTTIRDNTGEVVFTNLRDDVYMAPNSSFHHELGLDGLQMSEEMYEVTFLLESGPYSWPPLVTQFEGTGTLLEEPEPGPEPEPAQEVEEPVDPPQAELLDEENLTNILVFLMIIGGIFLITLIVVSIVRSKKSRIDNFEEVHGQILATLMSDEEGKARSTKREVKTISKDKVAPSKGGGIEALFMDQEDFEDEDSFDKEQKRASHEAEKETSPNPKDLEKEASIKPKKLEGKRSSKLEELEEETSPKGKDLEKDMSPKAKGLEKEKSLKTKDLEKETSPKGEDLEKETSPRVKDLEEETSPRAKEIEEKEKELERKVKALERKTMEIEKKEKTIVAKEKSIEEIAKTIEDKAKTIEDKFKTIEDKVKNIEELEKEVERKEKEQRERVAAKKKRKPLERKKEEWDIEI